MVNWAPIREGTARGGGVNGYAQGLALELIRLGHEVVSLCGGMRYEAGSTGGGIAPCRIARQDDWRGIPVYEVVNSPVLAPSLDQFRDPLGEISQPELEGLVADLMLSVRPDIVHFHNIEGFSAGCAAAIRRACPNVRIVFSLHNYQTICSQVYLMQGHRRPCRTFDAGHACATCVPAISPLTIKRRRAGLEPSSLPPPPAPPPPLPLSTSNASVAWPPRFVPGRGPHPYYCEDVPGWRPLLNTVTPEPPSDKPPNDYAARRAAMVAMLSACDEVLAVSEFVGRKFATMGVDAGRLTVCRIGSRMAELGAECRRARAARPPATGPLRIAFMGYNNWYKGLPMLFDSLDLLTPEVLGRLHLHVYALEGQQMEPWFRRLESRLAGLTLRHGYAYEEIPRLLEQIDLGLIPSVWWDNGPQTVMEFFACGVPVLGAELGGIPDFVEPGRTGLLFRGNDRWDLARHLALAAADPGKVRAMSAHVRPPKSMADHASELDAIYRRRLS